MKKTTVLGVSLICALMLAVGFAPGYIDFAPMPNTSVAGIENIFLPPVAAAEMPVLLQVPLTVEPANSSDLNCGICACGYGSNCDCGCGQ